jgi:EmrB/QacA subfamily drug resistance transporter
MAEATQGVAAIAADAPAETAAETAEKLKTERLLLLMAALATSLAPLNSTMIAVALPSVVAEFAANIAVAGWLVTGYLIAMASLQPVAGKLGDRFGRRRLILGGLLYFGLVSLGATVAPSLELLLLFRIQQGVAGALVFPNAAALLRDVVPAQRRATRFGLLGAVVSVAAAAGPPLGGLLVGTIGWRAIFLMNIPLLLPALLLGWRYIPRTARPAADGSYPRFDSVGAIWLSVVLASMAWVLTQSRNGAAGWQQPAGLVVALLAVLFFYYELRHADPVLQPRLFRHRSFAAACATVAFSNLAMYNTLLAMPILLALQAGWGEFHIGLALMSLSATSVIFSPLGGRLADRYGRRWPTVAGMAVSVLGFSLLVVPGALASPLLLLTGLAIAGIGLGISSSGLQTAAVEAVAQSETGVAAGVFSTSRYLGSIVGSSILAALLSAGAGLPAFHAVFLLVVAAAVVSVLTSLGLHDRPQR